MPTLTQTTTTVATTTHEITLKPSVRKKLLTRLNLYAATKQQIAALEDTLDATKLDVEEILLETGEKSLALDEGYKLTLVEGTSKRLDEKKLIALGVTMAQIQAATVETPKKPYVKITLPGVKAREF